MRSRLVLAALVGAAVVAAVLLIVLAGDDPTSTRPAATVNGVEVSQHDVIAELDAIAANDAYLQSRAADSTVRIRGDDPTTYDAAFVADILQRWVTNTLIASEVKRLGLRPDDECRLAARNVTTADLGESTFTAFPAAYQDRLVEWNLNELLLTAYLADQACVAADAAKAYYDSHLSEFQEVCLSLIRTSTGATESLGCKPKNQVPDDFLAAAFETAIGEVSAPIETVEGPVSLRVDDRRQLPLDQVREQASELAAIAATNAFDQWLRQAVRSATVVVDPEYGTWNQQTLSIDPPGSPGSPSTTEGAVAP